MPGGSESSSLNSASRQAFIRKKAVQHRIKWSRHALGELAPDTLSVDAVELALQGAVVIEDYLHMHRPLPDCLALAFVDLNEPIHVVVAMNGPRDYILIVTVYRPTVEEWENDWRTRKR